MKKQEAVQKVKEGTHAIEMNRKEPKHINLLRDILKEAFPNDDLITGGSGNYYTKDYYNNKEWNYYAATNLPTIKITEIEQEETFESGELVEVSHHGDKWIKETYGFTTKKGNFITQDDEGRFSSWYYIRKINPAIEQIREIMKKNNISKEEI
jgi:hypothetical protein